MKLKKYIKYLIFVLFIGGMAFLYHFSLARNTAKTVSDILIEFEEGDNNFLTHLMVNKLLIQNHKTVKNKAKSVINLYKLENAVLKNPYVEKSAVFLTIDGVLKSTIKQRKAIARVITNKSSYYIDKQGVYVPLSDNYSARVPLITGVEDGADLRNVIALMNVIMVDDFLHKEIVEIHQSDVDNYQFLVRSGNYKIEFGKLEDVATKFKKLKAFYNKAFLDKTIEQYKTINLKYHHQVVCEK